MIYRGNSYAIVACGDKFTANWVKTATLAFKFEGISTRAWSRWEKQESWIYSLFLTGEYWKTAEPNFVLSSIFKLNDLIGDFCNVTMDKKANPDGVYLSFEPISEKLIFRARFKSKT